jgi:hypothetical protein
MCLFHEDRPAVDDGPYRGEFAWLCRECLDCFAHEDEVAETMTTTGGPDV